MAKRIDELSDEELLKLYDWVKAEQAKGIPLPKEIVYSAKVIKAEIIVRKLDQSH